MQAGLRLEVFVEVLLIQLLLRELLLLKATMCKYIPKSIFNVGLDP